MRDVFMAGSTAPLMESLPTLAIVILGGITGGITAAMFEKHLKNA